MSDMGIFDPTPLISPAGRLGSCLDEDRPLESLCPDQAWPTETSRPRMTWRMAFFELPRETSRKGARAGGQQGARLEFFFFQSVYCLMMTRVENQMDCCQCQERRR